MLFNIILCCATYSRGFKKDENDEWVYELENGKNDTNNFHKSGSKNYWFGENSRIEKDMIIKDREKNVYFLNSEGCPICDTAVIVNKNTKSNFKIDKEYEYYFNNKSGKAEYKVDKETNEKIVIEKKLVYNKDGSINYVDQDGDKIKDFVIGLKDEKTGKNDMYYFDAEGNRVSNYLLTDYRGRIYYFDSDGKRVKKADVLVDKTTNANIKSNSKCIYHFDSSGAMSGVVDMTVDRDYHYDIDARTIKTDLNIDETLVKTDIKETNNAEIKPNSSGEFIFGVYEQDNNLDNGEENIKWLLIDENDEEYVLISDIVLECNNYDDGEKYVPYNKSGLSGWLNDYFLWSAFSEAEQAKIVKNNECYVSIPTVDDLEKLKKRHGEEKIKAIPSAYAVKHGSEMSEGGYTSYWIDEKGNGDRVKWVGATGTIYNGGQDLRLRRGDGIRPVIHIKK